MLTEVKVYSSDSIRRRFHGGSGVVFVGTETYSGKEVKIGCLIPFPTVKVLILCFPILKSERSSRIDNGRTECTKLLRSTHSLSECTVP